MPLLSRSPTSCRCAVSASRALGLQWRRLGLDRNLSFQGSSLLPTHVSVKARSHTLKCEDSGKCLHNMDPGWQTLSTTRQELDLDLTLPTGQSFRWRPVNPGEYVGVLGQRAVHVKQREGGEVECQVIARGQDADSQQDAAVLTDYFNLETVLSEVGRTWSADARFGSIHPYFNGARIMRQDPTECLFQFICSSNNHISRIHGMVTRICAAYGTPLQPDQLLTAAFAAGPHQTKEAVPADGQDLLGGPFYAFPTLQQLATATEADLRAMGFGYRAKFIVGSVQALNAQPGGGDAYLHQLRKETYAEASAALCALPGVGPKVAACVCLFALDKHEAIPVDTHVWQLATRYYLPSLKGKTLTPRIMAQVEQAFQAVFGPYAGWAHNTLFVSELASQQHRLPPHLVAKAKRKASQPGPPAGLELDLGEPVVKSEAGKDLGEPGVKPEAGAEPAAAPKRRRRRKGPAAAEQGDGAAGASDLGDRVPGPAQAEVAVKGECDASTQDVAGAGLSHDAGDGDGEAAGPGAAAVKVEAREILQFQTGSLSPGSLSMGPQLKDQAADEQRPSGIHLTKPHQVVKGGGSVEGATGEAGSMASRHSKKRRTGQRQQ